MNLFIGCRKVASIEITKTTNFEQTEQKQVRTDRTKKWAYGLRRFTRNRDVKKSQMLGTRSDFGDQPSYKVSSGLQVKIEIT